MSSFPSIVRCRSRLSRCSAIERATSPRSNASSPRYASESAPPIGKISRLSLQVEGFLEGALGLLESALPPVDDPEMQEGVGHVGQIVQRPAQRAARLE